MICLESSTFRLDIDPALGAGWRSLEIHGPDERFYPLLRSAPPGAAWFNHLASYLLAPWSNRVPAGRFTFAGVEHSLRPDWPDSTAIHGLVKDRQWRLLDRSPSSARLEIVVDDGFPWAFRARARYALGHGDLSARLEVTNLAGAPMPAGLGFHPFFRRRLWKDAESVRLRANLLGRYPANGMIPTGPAADDEVCAAIRAGCEIGSYPLDDVFAGSLDGASLEWPASRVRLGMRASPSLAHAVIYTGDPDGVCVEPVTMVNDGFNLRERGVQGTGVVVLGPGESLDAWWSMHVEPTA